MSLKIGEIKTLLKGDILLGEDKLDRQVNSACGSDLMSDVLAFVKDQTLLLTGLTNPQVIRTAELLDVTAIVFVRGKKPNDEMIQMADSRDIVLLSTEYTLYEACGILYNAGLPGGARI